MRVKKSIFQSAWKESIMGKHELGVCEAVLLNTGIFVCKDTTLFAEKQTQKIEQLVRENEQSSYLTRCHWANVKHRLLATMDHWEEHHWNRYYDCYMVYLFMSGLWDSYKDRAFGEAMRELASALDGQNSLGGSATPRRMVVQDIDAIRKVMDTYGLDDIARKVEVSHEPKHYARSFEKKLPHLVLKIAVEDAWKNNALSCKESYQKLMNRAEVMAM